MGETNHKPFELPVNYKFGNKTIIERLKVRLIIQTLA